MWCWYKSPQTPIQLSAERLKRKYLGEVTSEPDVFETCTDTIIRHVGDIGRMVDEFSAFARMPAPTMKRENLSTLCREAVFLQSTAHPDIEYDCVVPETPLYLRCDGRQMTQVLTNLLKNAVDSILDRQASTSNKLAPGHVALSVAATPDGVVIKVRDNGKGIPVELRDRLTEPYVTTRARGTGLGLAIVKKIMEDHSGDLTLDNHPEGGAEVTLFFPRREGADGESGSPIEQDADSPAASDDIRPLQKTASHGA